MRYFIEIETSGYFMLEVDDETGEDMYGNDQSDLIDAINLGNGENVVDFLDWLLSDIENSVDITVRDEDGNVVLSW